MIGGINSHTLVRYSSTGADMDAPLNASRHGNRNQPRGVHHSSNENRSRSRSRDRPTKESANAITKFSNKTDPDLPHLDDDPRSSDPSKRISNKALSQSKGRNTESFHAESTFVRPDLRIQIGSNRVERYNKKLKHDDVVIVPELFGNEEDWSIYYKLVEEMREIQKLEKEQQNDPHNGENTRNNGNSGRNNNNGRNNNRRHGGNSKSEWIPWHEGAHLISKKPDDSPTYQSIIKRLCDYFHIDSNKPVGTRFNWYRDSNDWKPFHHDSAAFNAQRAKSQNITIGASFGAMRELAFIRTQPYARNNDENVPGRGRNHHEEGPENKCKLYFPQNNNGVFSFGRDANILWKHGVNALPPSEQDGRGRISIILWGYAKDVIEEKNSPPLLGSDGTGPHAAGSYHNGRGRSDHRNNRGRGNGRDQHWRRHDRREYDENRNNERHYNEGRFDERGRHEDRGFHRGRGRYSNEYRR